MKQTHTGTVKGIAYMSGHNKQYRFRETKNYWICQYGIKYNKKNGSLAGEKYPLRRLDISTLKKIENSNDITT